MKQKNFFLVLAIALILPLVSCTKEETEIDKLCSGTWNLTYLETGGIRVSATAADMDMEFTFKSNGDWTGLVSSDGDTSSGYGTYTLSSDILKMREDLGGGDITTLQWTVIKLTKDEMILEMLEGGVSILYGFAH
jgi:hypothetical protein